MEQPDSSNIQYISEPGKVDELQQQLFDLKHNGQSLREIFEANRRARDERYNDLVIEPIKLIPHRVRDMCKYLKKKVQEFCKKVKKGDKTKKHCDDKSEIHSDVEP